MNEPSYWVTAHLSVNFVPVFSTEPSFTQDERTKAAYKSSGTQLYTKKSLLLPFQQNEGTTRCVRSPLWLLMVILPPAFKGLAGIINSETDALSQNLFSRNA